MTRSSRRPARVALQDGTCLAGRSFGARTESIGELVFNTSITGYQEILTDPSYRGQTVLLTQPHIGNYGVNSEDEESNHLWLSGLIVREASRLLNDKAHYRKMARSPNPFGDGRAARRIHAALRHFFGLGPRPLPWKGP